jgi:general secretion pathway protein K
MKEDDSRRGAILVTVLWSVALLSALAMAASTTFRGFAGILSIDRDRIQADGLLTAGLEAAASLVGTLGETPLRNFETTVVLSTGSVRVTLNDEGGRIDIARTPAEVLEGLFRAIGGSDQQASELARRTVSWRSTDPPTDLPQNTGQGTVAESVFSDVRQLAQVPGMPPEWVDALAPLTTIFGSSTINPLTAPAGVIAALPGIDQARLQTFLRAREISPKDSPQLAMILAPAQKYLEAKQQKAISVLLAARVTDGFAQAAQAVIVLLPEDVQPYRILVWNPLPSSRSARP